MSKFFTGIPLEISTIKGLMPKGSITESIKLDLKAERLNIEWENADVRTAYTYPVEVTIEDLRERRWPAGVVNAPPKEPAIVPGPDGKFAQVTVDEGPAKSGPDIKVKPKKTK